MCIMLWCSCWTLYENVSRGNWNIWDEIVPPEASNRQSSSRELVLCRCHSTGWEYQNWHCYCIFSIFWTFSKYSLSAPPWEVSLRSSNWGWACGEVPVEGCYCACLTVVIVLSLKRPAYCKCCRNGTGVLYPCKCLSETCYLGCVVLQAVLVWRHLDLRSILVLSSYFTDMINSSGQLVCFIVAWDSLIILSIPEPPCSKI